MRPKGKLFALVAVFAAIGVVVATGAFTTVSADRTADVTAAGDASALLALEPHTGTNGGAYAQSNSGQLELDLSGNQGASGVNIDALTEVNNVFNITNNGAQNVEIYISRTGANSGVVSFYSGTVSGTNMTTSSNAVTVTSGETITVSMEIDTRDAGLTGSDDILSEITINATAV